ncbi:Apl5 protein [Saccharomycopsis crataegensis]|uniref:AP-3 complex subunit delta n=1 Tax=Saccharomycopsis crataegensis TaxID=43959 RepID=A0AAV5QUR7_9ASCO|nr:Apl5 protein [Saccharomycopsis crataegensis]
MSLNPGEDVKSRLRPFGIVFEKSLRDLIKGIRAHKEPEAQSEFLLKAITECRQEVKSSDMDLKTMTILKLCYLEMYGFDMSWANFNVLEVMSSSKFQQKRVGYLAAGQAFRNEEDVLMLATNLLKKDLNSSSSVEVGVALSGISSVVNPTLARDVTDDIIKMLNHSKPYIRKKAVLALYKIFLQYPEALRTSFDRLCDKLDDEDDSVMAATVTVICELAKKAPKNFVNLAPRLHAILSTTKNNWVIIRLLKLFSSLAKIEPRLNSRLIPKILEIVETTGAMSLIYECINCIVVGEMLDDSNLDVAQICVDNLKPFFTATDPNLQYVGLLTLNKIATIQPHIISEQSKVIIGCLVHPDLSIRKQALDLLEYVVSEDNLEQAVSILINELLPNNTANSSNEIVLDDDFKVSIINRILDSCVFRNYTNISDFDWFISVLSDLIKISAEYNLHEIGPRLGIEFRNVLVKIPSIRSAIINDCLVDLVQDELVVSNLLGCMPEILWAIGEYSTMINDPNSLLFNLSDTFQNGIVSGDDAFEETGEYDKTLVILIPTLVKILNAYANGNSNYMWNYQEKQKVMAQLTRIIDFLNKTSVSKNFNVQERSIEFLEFLKLLKEAMEELSDDSLQSPLLLSQVLPSLFNSWELNPIAKDVQKAIAVPDELDLDAEIYPVDGSYSDPEDGYLKYRNPEYYNAASDSDISDSENEFTAYSNPLLGIQGNGVDNDGMYHDDVDELIMEDDTEAREKRRLKRLERQKNDPFYLKSEDEVNVSVSKDSFIEMDSDNDIKASTKKITSSKTVGKSKTKKVKKAKPVVLAEEVLFSGSGSVTGSANDLSAIPEGSKTKKKTKKNILKIDASGLENFDLNGSLEPEFSPQLEKEIGYVVEDVPDNTITNNNDQGELVVVSKKKKKSKKKSGDEDGTKKKKKTKTDAEGNVIEVKRKSKKKVVKIQ